MDLSETPAKELLTLQAWGAQTHQESQLPLCADFANMSTPSHEAGVTAKRDAIDGAHTVNCFDAQMNETQLAQAALDYGPKHHQVSIVDSNMESTKALLQNFLADLKESQTEHSFYLDGLLSQWLDIWRRDRSHALLIYVLGGGSEQYQDRILALSNLETIDKIKTSILQRQCSEQGACLHLARMKSTVSIDSDEALELKMAINLREIRDLSGGLLVDKPVTVGRESIIQKALLKERYHRAVASRNPYPSPSEGSPTLGTNTSENFQDWVLVMMPEGYRFKFLTENANSQALHEWIKAQLTDLQPSRLHLTGTDTNVRWGLTLACKTQLTNIDTWIASGLDRENPEAWNRRSNQLEAIVSASLRLGDPDLFGKAINLNPRMLPITEWIEVGNTMELASFSSYRNSLNQALARIDSFQDRYIILHSIRDGCQTRNQLEESMEIIDKWFQDQVQQAMSDIERVEENDGAVLVIVAKRFANTISIHRIVSFAKKHCSNHKFAIEFAFSLYDDLVQDNINAGQAKYLLTQILSAAVPAICVRGPDNWSLGAWFPCRASDTSARGRQIIQADRMSRLLRCCLTVGLYNEERQLLRHIWLDAKEADAPTLQHVFLPYLTQLLLVMHDYRIPMKTQSYQWQFQQVLSLFIIRYIGKEPRIISADFTCPPLGCSSPTKPYGCKTCLDLEAFLTDPYRQMADVTGGIDAPEHVAAQIQGTNYLQMTVISHSAERMTSTIRITKSKRKSEEPDARHDLWTERVIKANDLIQAICGDEQWKLLLGDRYDECMGLKMVRT